MTSQSLELEAIPLGSKTRSKLSPLRFVVHGNTQVEGCKASFSRSVCKTKTGLGLPDSVPNLGLKSAMYKYPYFGSRVGLTDQSSKPSEDNRSSSKISSRETPLTLAEASPYAARNFARSSDDSRIKSPRRTTSTFDFKPSLFRRRSIICFSPIGMVTLDLAAFVTIPL